MYFVCRRKDSWLSVIMLRYMSWDEGIIGVLFRVKKGGSRSRHRKLIKINEIALVLLGLKESRPHKVYTPLVQSVF